MGSEDTGCHGELGVGKGPWRPCWVHPQTPSALRAGPSCHRFWCQKDSLLFHCFPSKMVALLSLEPARPSLA